MKPTWWTVAGKQTLLDRPRLFAGGGLSIIDSSDPNQDPGYDASASAGLVPDDDNPTERITYAERERRRAAKAALAAQKSANASTAELEGMGSQTGNASTYTPSTPVQSSGGSLLDKIGSVAGSVAKPVIQGWNAAGNFDPLGIKQPIHDYVQPAVSKAFEVGANLQERTGSPLGQVFNMAEALHPGATKEGSDLAAQYVAPDNLRDLALSYGPAVLSKAPTAVKALDEATKAANDIKAGEGLTSVGYNAGIGLPNFGKKLTTALDEAAPAAERTPIMDLTDAIKSAEKARPEQQAMFDAQRAQRTAASANAMSSASGFDKLRAFKGPLAGEFERPQFSIPQVSRQQLDQWSEMIDANPNLQHYDKGNALEALNNIFVQNRIPEPAKMKTLISAFGNDPEFAQSMGDLIRKAAPPSLADYAGEWWMNSVLSNPLSHARNFLGNMTSSLFAPVETLGSAAIERPLAFVQGRAPERSFAEVPAQITGMVKGIPEGVQAALQTFRYGANPLEVTRADIGRTPAFTGWLGRVIHAPTNLMEAGDQFFYAINYRGALNTEAIRAAQREGLSGRTLLNRAADLMDSPTPEMVKAASRNAEYRLFRQPAGDVTQKIIELRNTAPGLKYIIPFVRTPVNLAKFGLERSPAAFLNPQLIKNIATKNPEAADQLSRALIGSTILSGFGAALASGNLDITAAAPTTAAARDRFYREGKQPFAIKIGDHWVGYSQLQPLAETLTMLAATVDAVRNNQDPAAAALQAATTVGQNLADQTYMTGLSNLMDAINDPQNKAQQFATSTGQGFVPFSGTQRFLANVTDTRVRQPEGWAQRFETNIPGLSQNVPPRLTAFGEEAQRQNPASPIQITRDQTSAVDAELGRLGVEVGFAGNSIGGKALDRDQQETYQRITGQLIELKLGTLLRSSKYQAATDVDKQNLMEDTIRQAREQARNTVEKQLKALAQQRARETLGLSR